MKRTYDGNYWDFDAKGNEVAYAFRLEVDLDEKYNFSGVIWEEEFTGLTGEKASVKGFIDQDHISFVKKYPFLYTFDEDGGIFTDELQPGHEVIYDGYWIEEDGCWRGDWEVEGETEIFHFDHIKTIVYLGRFEMKMADK